MTTQEWELQLKDDLFLVSELIQSAFDVLDSSEQRVSDLSKILAMASYASSLGLVVVQAQDNPQVAQAFAAGLAETFTKIQNKFQRVAEGESVADVLAARV